MNFVKDYALLNHETKKNNNINQICSHLIYVLVF